MEIKQKMRIKREKMKVTILRRNTACFRMVHKQSSYVDDRPRQEPDYSIVSQGRNNDGDKPQAEPAKDKKEDELQECTGRRKHQSSRIRQYSSCVTSGQLTP